MEEKVWNLFCRQILLLLLLYENIYQSFDALGID
jgi:hypothetical protein